MREMNFPWVKKGDLAWSASSSSGTYFLTVDVSVYSLDAVLKTCYLFLDQCYLFVEPASTDENQINVYFSPLNESDELEKLIGEFSNRLLWQEVRRKVADETQGIRELIVAQALAEGNMLEEQSSTGADYHTDPLKIAQ